ncbi:hypothetical protein CR513_05470, partial [Mucuna pruriens]
MEELQEVPKEREASEFLKLIRHSEYEMVDQLNKTPARISLLSLLVNSEGHRQLLLKVLNEAHVTKDISVEKFGGIVGSLTTANHISFSGDELPEGGRNHNLPLHIVVRCGDYIMARVLIDNASFLNVMPKTTLDKLFSTGAQLRTSPIIVRAFDSSKPEVMGEITLPIRIGPTTFNVDFQIHKAGAIPSSLHQKVKFITDQRLISVKGEEDLMISTPMPIEYTEGNEKALEASFQSLEIVGTEHEGDSKTAKAMFTIVEVLMKAGYQPGKGLGKSLNGITEPITLQENHGKVGLGFYSQGHPEKAREMIKIASDLYQWFTSRGIVSPNPIAMIANQDPSKQEWIYLSSEKLANWESNTLPTPVFQITSPSTHNDNAILEPNESSDPNNQDQGQDEEVPTLAELEKDLEHSKLMMQPLEESTKVIDIGTGEVVKEVKIGKRMPMEIRSRIIELLKEYSDVFAWLYHDMPGLNTNIVEHKLPIIPGATPQWNASFLAVAEYPQWVANIVPILKKDGKVCICVDYRDLNIASVKDNFPLPHIDVLVDNTVRHQIFPFMDGFSRYNQIRMAPEDREKTMFIIAWGTF